MTHKKLSARILSLVLTVAMVGTMMPSTVLAAEGEAALGTSSTEKITRTITAFDELEGYTKSVPFDEHTYAVSVALNTPVEKIKLPTELSVTVESTTTTTPPAKDEVVNSGEAPEETTPALEQEESSVTTVTEETIPVTWKNDKEYNPTENSKMIYTAVLPESYAIADGVKTPQIYLIVGKQARAREVVIVNTVEELQTAITSTTDDLSLQLSDTFDSTKNNTSIVIASENDNDITMDLNGKTLNSTAGITIENFGTGTFTVADTSGGSTGILSNTYTGYYGSSTVIENSSRGTINITGGTIRGSRLASSETISNAYISGTVPLGGTVNVSGGKVEAIASVDGKAITSYGTVNISGGTVESTGKSGSAIFLDYAATTTITGGTISATGSAIKIQSNSTGIVNIGEDSGITTTISSDSATIYHQGTGALIITGGKIKSTDSSAVMITAAGKTTITGTAKLENSATDSDFATISLTAVPTVTTADKVVLTIGTGVSVKNTYLKGYSVKFRNNIATKYNVRKYYSIENTAVGGESKIFPEPAKFTLKFEGITDPIKDITGYANDTITLPIPTSDNETTFIGWYTSLDSTGKLVTADTVYTAFTDVITTIYAKFAKAITFDARNGTTISPAEISADGKITLPANLTWGDYTFDGWWTGIDGTGTEVTVDTVFSANTTVYAKWTKGSKTVRTEPLDLTASLLPTNLGDQGWTWDADKSTLTLDGMNIAIGSSYIDDESKSLTAIKMPSNAIIVVNGQNKLNTMGPSTTYVYGIKGTKDITFNGTGSFDLEIYDNGGNQACGIDGESLTIDGSLNVGVTGDVGHGIKANNSIIIKGGTISVQTLAKPTYPEPYAFKAKNGTITAEGATVTGANQVFISGVTKTLTGGTVVISLSPSIAVDAQTGAATYGTAASPTFSVTNSNFGGGYPDFDPSVLWIDGSAPTGVTTAFSGTNNETLTVNTTSATPAGEYKFKVVSAKSSPETGDYESTEATLKVDRLVATIAWGTINSFTYNGSEQAPTASVSNKVGTDAVSVSVTGGQSNVGTDITATANELIGAAASNYAMPSSKPTQAFAINAKEVTVTDGTLELKKAFDNSMSAGTVTSGKLGLTGVVGSDDVSVKVDTIGAYTDVNIGKNKAVTLTISLDGVTKDNYTLGSNTYSFTKAEITKIAYIGLPASAPDNTPENKSDKSITIKPVIPPTDENVEYAMSKNSTVPTSDNDWQDGTTFNNLNPNSEYFFFARVKENDNHAAGGTSSGTSITTDKSSYTTKTSAPDDKVQSKTDINITLNPVTPPTGETVQYAMSKTNVAPTSDDEWQDERTFDSLDSNTDYYFFARVKENDIHKAGPASDETKIKTDLSDVDKIAAAKKVVESALKEFNATNVTDANAIMALANKAISDAGIIGVTLSWDVSGAFDKSEATEDAKGKVTGTIKLSCGTENATVTLNKTIAQLPNDPNEKIATVKAAIEAALNAYTATNDTTVVDIKALVDKVNVESGVKGVKVDWKLPSDFKNNNSTNEKDGKITGTLVFSCTTSSASASDTLSVNRPILRTDDQKLGYAKEKAEAALNDIIGTNLTSAEEIMKAVNDAIAKFGVSATWKVGSDFKKVLATDKGTGSITGTITLALNGKTVDITLDKTIRRFIQQELISTGETDKVKVSGMISEHGKLYVELIAAKGGYENLKAKVDTTKNEIIGAFEARVIGGTYDGKLIISFGIGEKYNGKIITIYHQKADGTIETFITACKNGEAVITVDELSPFVLSVPKDASNSGGITREPSVPATGDNSNLTLLLILLLSSSGTCTVLFVRRRKVANRL
ncbi:beta strand repeat-containing protein [Amedibacillus sp. YH-ame6]